ncbi:MAG: DUF4397 domain-containing protein [Pedobacter sp.]|nr:DUF4397 domain-containing protein [Pedobacter sp.]
MKIKSLIAALAITTLLGSCMKDQDIQPQQPVAGLSIVQASPTTENLDVYVDNTRAVFDLAYAKKVDYLNLFPGNRKLTITKKRKPDSFTGRATYVKRLYRLHTFYCRQIGNSQIFVSRR